MRPPCAPRGRSVRGICAARPAAGRPSGRGCSPDFGVRLWEPPRLQCFSPTRSVERGWGGSFSARPLNPGPDSSRGKVGQPPRGSVGRSSGDGGKEKRAPGCGSARAHGGKYREEQETARAGGAGGLSGEKQPILVRKHMYIHVYMQHIRKAVVQVHRRTRLLFAQRGRFPSTEGSNDWKGRG